MISALLCRNACAIPRRRGETDKTPVHTIQLGMTLTLHHALRRASLGNLPKLAKTHTWVPLPPPPSFAVASFSLRWGSSACTCSSIAIFRPDPAHILLIHMPSSRGVDRRHRKSRDEMLDRCFGGWIVGDKRDRDKLFSF